MRTPNAFILLASLLASAFLASAQEAKPATNAPQRRVQAAPLVSPELLSDHGVTFCFRAPKAFGR